MKGKREEGKNESQEESNVQNKNDLPEMLRVVKENRRGMGKKDRANCILARTYCLN